MRRWMFGLVALLFAFAATGTAYAQVPVSQFDAILAAQVVATNSMITPSLTATTINATSLVGTSSNIGAASATTFSTTGLASLTSVSLPVGSQQTVVASSVISATSAFVAVTAAAPVSVGDIQPGVNGQILTIVNAGTNAITVPDSGLNRLSAAAVLGQYDTLTLIWYAAAWNQLSTSNN